MPAAKAPSIQLSPDHDRQLKALARAHSTPQKLAERARIILLASAGWGVCETAQELCIWRKRCPIVVGALLEDISHSPMALADHQKGSYVE